MPVFDRIPFFSRQIYDGKKNSNTLDFRLLLVGNIIKYKVFLKWQQYFCLSIKLQRILVCARFPNEPASQLNYKGLPLKQSTEFFVTDGNSRKYPHFDIPLMYGKEVQGKCLRFLRSVTFLGVIEALDFEGKKTMTCTWFPWMPLSFVRNICI